MIILRHQTTNPGLQIAPLPKAREVQVVFFNQPFIGKAEIPVIAYYNVV
jgi:hypothetical protein